MPYNGAAGRGLVRLPRPRRRPLRRGGHVFAAQGSVMNKSADIARPTGEAFHRKYRNAFVGMFILIVLVIVGILFLFTVFRDVLEKWDYLYVKYDTASGLAKNGAVTILGMKVGVIKDVSLSPSGRIDVKLKIRRMYMPYIHRDSRARLQQKNIAIGDWEIDLTRGSPGS